jgi:hypothetical protein
VKGQLRRTKADMCDMKTEKCGFDKGRASSK